MTADGALDFTRGRRGVSPYDGAVGTVDGPIGELGDQRGVGFRGLGGNHHAAGVLVEAMHNARTANPTDSGEVFSAMGDQSIDQSVVRVAWRRMHHKPCRFVDNDQVGVFMQDFQVHGLPDGDSINNCRDRNGQPVTVGYLL